MAGVRRDLSAFAYQRERLLRHARWLRTEGPRRLIEEDGLDFRRRRRLAREKAAWRAAHPVPRGEASAVYVVGLQRSGTNMVVRGFEESPAFEVHNENDQSLFSRFRLRDEATLRRVVEESAHRHVLVKPLCDSHRTLELLDVVNPATARALWVYRGVDDRSRSAVAKFGADARQALIRIAADDVDGLWQAGGLSVGDRALVKQLDPPTLDPLNASALLWYLRNGLFFTLGLHRDPRVALVRYEDYVREPGETMRRLCQHLNVSSIPPPPGGVRRDSLTDVPAPLRSDIRELCRSLGERLDMHRISHAAS